MSFCSAGRLHGPYPFNYCSRFASQLNHFKMRHSNMRYLFSLYFILGATGFSLFDRQTSYVEFERLRSSTDGKFGVSFRCKTYAKTGLLFYVDDEGFGEYLTLYLRDGFLLLELSDGSGNIFEAKSKVIINDLQWHGIEVELGSHHAVYRLDNATQAEFNITKMQLKSDLYIGGFPNDIDIFSLSQDEMMFAQRFLGCFEDVEFSSNVGNVTQTRTKVLRSAGMDLECKDACKPKSPCRNDGVCVNKFAVAECLCAETGYRGKICEKESPVVGISPGDHRVTFDVLSSYIAASSETTSMFVRVRSTQQDGVFFYTAYNGDYILLELTNGRIAASVNLGSGSVTIATKKNTYNDNQWHRVKLERVKRLVNLTVDNSDTSKGKTKGVFDKLHLPNKKISFVLGGLVDDKKTKLKSLSRKNFTGCLQELLFNGYDLFGEFNKSAKEIASRGKFLKTCPKTPTKPPKVVTTFPKIQTTVSDPFNTSTPVFGTLKTTTTDQKLPCILAGISCEVTTTGVPTSQAHVVTSSQVKSVTTTGTLSSTSGKRVYTNNQSGTSSKTLIQSTIGPKSTKITHSTKTDAIISQASPSNSKTSQNLSTNKNVQSTASQPFSTNKKVTQDNSMPRTTGEVIMANRNERNESDLTIYFIIAAVVGLLAFLLAILIIVKVNWASKKKYAVKGKKYERDYWADTGSFQRSAKQSKPLV